jgi:cell division septal protein FtsQ
VSAKFFSETLPFVPRAQKKRSLLFLCGLRMRLAGGGGARGNVSLKRKKERALLRVFFFLMILCVCFCGILSFFFSFVSRKRFSLIFSTLVRYCVFLYISLVFTA